MSRARRLEVLTVGLICALIVSLIVNVVVLMENQELRMRISRGGSQPFSYTVKDVEVIVNCTLPNYPMTFAKLMVMELNYTEEELLSIAELFSMTENATIEKIESPDPHRRASYHILEDPPKYLELYFYGAMLFHADELARGSLPLEAEAMTVANQSLSVVLAHPLSPIHERMQVEIAGIKNLSKIFPTWLISCITSFDGISIMNHEAGIEVGGGSEGEALVIRFTAYWRRVAVEGSINTSVGPFEAIEQIDPIRLELAERPEVVIINQVHLAYWAEDGLFESQAYVPPVYVIKYTEIQGNKTIGPLEDVIPATDLSFGSA